MDNAIHEFLRALSLSRGLMLKAEVSEKLNICSRPARLHDSYR